MAGSHESKTAVLAALFANGAIACGKLAAGALTGSGAMFAEGAHSIADTVNQGFLLVGINLSDTKPDDEHPHGYGKEVFFWTFLAAVFIFVAGATFSFFEGIRSLFDNEFHARSAAELGVAFGVLGAAFLFECAVLVIATRALRRGARESGWSFWRYLRDSPDVTTKMVFFEDSAALTGLVLAALGLSISEAVASETPDAVASILIGFVLTAVALMIGSQARSLLLGEAASPEIRAKLRSIVMEFDEVELIVRMLTMQLGAESVLVTGELQVQPDLTAEEIEHLVRRIDEATRSQLPEISSAFWELHRHPLETLAGPRRSERS